MKAYRITDCAHYNPIGFMQPQFRATLDDVRAFVKAYPQEFRENLDIAEVEVPTDKASIISLLNDNTDLDAFKVDRMWSGTARGSIKDAQEEGVTP